MLVRNTLERLLNQTDSRRQKEVHASCSEALKRLESQEPLDIALVWEPFKLACDPKNPPQLRQLALDCIQKLLAHQKFDGSKFVETDSAKTATEGESVPDRPVSSSYPTILVDELVHTVCLAAPPSSFNDTQTTSPESMVHLQIVKALLTAVTSGACEVHEESLIKCLQACVNIFLYSRNLNSQTTAKAGLTQICHHIFSLIPKTPESSAPTSAGTSPVTPTSSSLSAYAGFEKIPVSSKENNPYQLSPDLKKQLLLRDAYFSFKFLCRLAMKVEKPTVNGSSAENSEAANPELSELIVRARTLGLEMILSLMTNSTQVFSTFDPFVGLLRSHVTLAVSKNGLSLHAHAFEYSLSIFLILIKSFRSVLKTELEVLFTEIYLYMLDNPNSSRKQKLMTLLAMYKVCSNPQILVDLYVNYDCDLNTANVYERLVIALEKLGKGAGVRVPVSGGNAKSVSVFAVDEKSIGISAADLERQLRTRALQCLAAVSISLHDWSKDEVNGISRASIVFEMVPKVQSPGSDSNQSTNPDGGKFASPETGSIAPVLLGKNPLQNLNLSEDSPTGSATDAHSNPDELEKTRQKKQALKLCIAKFNDSATKGVKMLREHGFVTDDASVVQFLLHTSEISKAAIGDFLGDGSTENIKIMHMFVDTFDFTGIEFVTALRQFLQAFRLPGEAQKIDRIMEKFAARYCENNPKIFAKADVAYTLAFSTIMLNTDLWSSRIKNKMTKADFIKNNRGINDNSDLPEEFLGHIYDDISNNEIVLEEERTIKELEKMTAVNTVNTREVYKRETQKVQQKSATLIKQKTDRVSAPFRHAAHKDYSRSMFESSWKLVRAIAVEIFEELACPSTVESTNLDSLPTSMGNLDVAIGCVLAIRFLVSVSCIYEFAEERKELMTSLSQMTGISDVTRLGQKNILALRTLLYVANTQGNYLDDSWAAVFRCLSLMDKHTLNESKKSTSTSPNGSKADDSTTHLASQEITIAVDKVFSNSQTLNGSAIIFFYRHLCAQAEDEVNDSRNYLTQKVVEISYYNMNRIRLEWSQIMKLLMAFFNKIGCNSNLAAATYAVDSLRQLSMKFLDRSELSHFHTNNDFLKPFEYIARHTPLPAVRELALQSIVQMVSARASNIKSGWKSVFIVLSTVAIHSNDSALAKRSFQILKSILHQNIADLEEFVIDYITCVVEFALLEIPSGEGSGEKDSPLADECISMLEQISNDLGVKSAEGTLISDDMFHLKWFPLLSGLSRVVRDCSTVRIRTKTVDLMFSILQSRGSLFSFEKGHWRTIIKSICMPVFEDMIAYSTLGTQEDGNAMLRDLSMTSTWIQCIRRISDVVSSFYEPKEGTGEGFRSNLDLVQTLLDLMVTLVGSNSENLSSTGVIYLSQFIQGNWGKFDENSWNMISGTLERIFRITLPVDLFAYPKKKPGDPQELANVKRAILKCSAHLLVLQMVRELCLLPDDCSLQLISGTWAGDNQGGISIQAVQSFPSPLLQSLPFEQKSKWLSFLHASHIFAKEFNANQDLRTSLLRSGVVQQMPNLVKQETQSIATYISLLFQSHRFHPEECDLSDEKDVQISTLLEPLPVAYRLTQRIIEPLAAECDIIIERFLSLMKDSSKNSRDITNWIMVVKLIFLEFSAVLWGSNDSDGNRKHVGAFKRLVPKYYRYAIHLMDTDKVDLRATVLLFLERIGNIIETEAFMALL